MGRLDGCNEPLALFRDGIGSVPGPERKVQFCTRWKRGLMMEAGIGGRRCRTHGNGPNGLSCHAEGHTTGTFPTATDWFREASWQTCRDHSLPASGAGDPPRSLRHCPRVAPVGLRLIFIRPPPGFCASSPGSPIPDFCVVTPDTLREGERPSRAGARWLLTNGVGSIVSIHVDDRAAFRATGCPRE